MLKNILKFYFRQDRCEVSQSHTTCPHSHSPRRLTVAATIRLSIINPAGVSAAHCSLFCAPLLSQYMEVEVDDWQPESKLRHDTTTSKFHSFLHTSDSYEKYAKVVWGWYLQLYWIDTFAEVTINNMFDWIHICIYPDIQLYLFSIYWHQKCYY